MKTNKPIKYNKRELTLKNLLTKAPLSIIPLIGPYYSVPEGIRNKHKILSFLTGQSGALGAVAKDTNTSLWQKAMASGATSGFAMSLVYPRQIVKLPLSTILSVGMAGGASSAIPSYALGYLFGTPHKGSTIKKYGVAESKAQQRFMGMVHAVQKGDLSANKVGPKVRKAAHEMSYSDTKDFASTKRKGLPEHAKTAGDKKHIAQDATGTTLNKLRLIKNPTLALKLKQSLKAGTYKAKSDTVDILNTGKQHVVNQITLPSGEKFVGGKIIKKEAIYTPLKIAIKTLGKRGLKFFREPPMQGSDIEPISGSAMLTEYFTGKPIGISVPKGYTKHPIASFLHEYGHTKDYIINPEAGKKLRALGMTNPITGRPPKSYVVQLKAELRANHYAHDLINRFSSNPEKDWKAIEPELRKNIFSYKALLMQNKFPDSINKNLLLDKTFMSTLRRVLDDEKKATKNEELQDANKAYWKILKHNPRVKKYIQRVSRKNKKLLWPIKAKIF